jgi:hypothetical protein
MRIGEIRDRLVKLRRLVQLQSVLPSQSNRGSESTRAPCQLAAKVSFINDGQQLEHNTVDIAGGPCILSCFT